MLARRAAVSIYYEGIDITENIQSDLLNFKYTDNAYDNADNISIELKDSTARWSDKWFPQKGDSIKADINTLNWHRDGEKGDLNCGTFIVDEPEYAGPPRKMTINAIAEPSNTDFTSTKKSRAWENIKLSAIANNIADSAGLDLLIDIPSDPLYSRQDQSETSDMSFLSELCKKEGFGFKITDNKIIIFDEKKYENKESVMTLTENSGMVNSYSFKTSLSNTSYVACRVRYRNAKKGAIISYLFSLKDDLEDGDKIYEVNQVVTSYEEAIRLAQKTLRNVNKKEWTATLNVIGDLRLIGGICVNLIGFGKFDGKYFVEKAEHNLPKYNVDLELHKVLEGY